MKVLILTEGGNEIGFGHLTRCIALAQGLQQYVRDGMNLGLGTKQKSAKINFFVDGDTSVRSLFSDLPFNVKSCNWVRKYKLLKSFLKHVDLVIIDSYRCPKRIYDFVSNTLSDGRMSLNRLICIDDHGRLSYPPSIVVNPSLYGDKIVHRSLHHNSLQPRYLSGKDYIIVRKEFWKVPRKRIKKHFTDVLITFGGAKQLNFIKRLLKTLSTKFPALRYHLITPNHYRNTIPNVTAYSNISASHILDLMLRCDIAIAGCGQTLHELARVGVPTIGICFAKNQTLNLKAFQKEQFLTYAGYYNNSRILEKTVDSIKTLSLQSTRKKISAIGTKIVDGKGIKRLFSKLQTIGLYRKNNNGILLRIADKDDCRDLWKWRKHPDILKWCFDETHIPYRKHKIWFRKKIRDRFATIFIAENNKREKVGQIRFERTSRRSRTYINVNLNPEFLGQGLGHKIIKFASQGFLQYKPTARQITAEILGANVVSKRAFIKAGYRFSHNITRDNHLIAILKFGGIS